VNSVNLLPVKHRPRTPTGGQQGSAYVVLGILGAVLVMTLIYVLTVNGINTRRSEVAKAKTETAVANARAAQLAAYGNFSQVKQQRVDSVKQLAASRIDWERLARGLALVLPDNVWLLTASAASSGKAANAASGNASSPVTSSATSANPSVQLTGCAPSHPQVAVTLVRLRELSGAQDVQLNEISQPDTTAATATGGSGATDCGKTHGKANFKWDATVMFAPNPGSTPDAAKKVPARLGGGA